jgi:peptide/nickel transport system substrate-binding protein
MEVKLRQGIKFHDGAPFTAADIKATYEYGCLPDRPAQWYPGLVSVEVVDDFTCRINTKAQGYPANSTIFVSLRKGYFWCETGAVRPQSKL